MLEVEVAAYIYSVYHNNEMNDATLYLIGIFRPWAKTCQRAINFIIKEGAAGGGVLCSRRYIYISGKTARALIAKRLSPTAHREAIVAYIYTYTHARDSKAIIARIYIRYFQVSISKGIKH